MVDGKAIARELDFLNDLARNNGIVPLETFLSTSADDLASLVGDDVVQGSQIDLPQEAWFEAEQGLSALQSLADLLTRDNRLNFEAIFRDLEAYGAVLRAAAAHGIRFHFAFDF